MPQDTLAGTIKEAMAQANKDGQKPVIQAQDVNKGNSGETQTGGTPEFVSGIDISDIPVEDRPRFKAFLEKKAALLEKGYQPKFQEVSRLKKAQENLKSLGLTVEEAEEVIAKHAEAKKNPGSDEKKSAVRTFDKLIEAATDEHKEGLRALRQAIVEETSADKLAKKVDELEKIVSYFRANDFQMREEKAVNELKGVSEKLGEDLITKYQDDIMAEWRKYPGASIKYIAKIVIPDDEYEQALLSKHADSRSKNKAQAITNNGSGVSGAQEAIDIKKETLGSLLRKAITKGK